MAQQVRSGLLAPSALAGAQVRLSSSGRRGGRPQPTHLLQGEAQPGAAVQEPRPAQTPRLGRMPPRRASQARLRPQGARQLHSGRRVRPSTAVELPAA